MFSYGKYEHLPFMSSQKLDSAPNLRAEDVTLKGSVEVYVLSLDTDLDKYIKLRSEESQGLVALTIEKNWVPEIKNWKVLVEVIRYYYTFKE